METHAFQAETRRLLDLVVHSLYTNRDIFLRELIANASDALDRLRLESLTHPDLWDGTDALEIRLEVDPAARTLTIRDNGIGMDRDEAIADLGTIARSGTQELVERLERERGERPTDLIGRFGVGFYSAFMVADKVTVTTRRAGAPRAARWESTGGSEYQLDEVEESRRGTAVTLHLKPAGADSGMEDYTSRLVLGSLVKRYADFVTYPIVFEGGEGSGNAERIVMNSMKPIWTRPEGDLKPEDYTQFYQHISGDWDEPLTRMAFKAEGRWEFSALVFVPRTPPYDIYYHTVAYGVQMYSRRMLIVENCSDVVPRYLRFLKGVVDAGDLPLNISRQSLQDLQHLTQIRKWLTRKVLDALAKVHAGDADKYLEFWRRFGRVLKEGISEDRDNQARLLALGLFDSSADPSAPTTLAAYVTRMKPDQKDIYYLTGASRSVIERAPQLEEFLARGYEVLYLSDPVDELVVQAVTEFDGRRLRSVAKGPVELGDAAEEERARCELKERTEAFDELLKFLEQRLAAHVRSVRLSRRLTTSPACLAGDEYDYSPQLERLLLHGKGAGPLRRRMLELNPQHPLVQHMHQRFRADPSDPLLQQSADLLFGYAVLAEGSELPDPVRFTGSLADIVGHVLAFAPVPAADVG